MRSIAFDLLHKSLACFLKKIRYKVFIRFEKMNKIIVIPKNFKIPETIRVASESVRANLAKKRAQRGTANALNEVTNPTD